MRVLRQEGEEGIERRGGRNVFRLVSVSACGLSAVDLQDRNASRGGDLRYLVLLIRSNGTRKAAVSKKEFG